MGYRSLGTGFLIEGSAKFVKSGADFDMMKVAGVIITPATFIIWGIELY
ncbi:MAG: hypothetical protein ACJAX4_002747 [Clostridium sp.]|jgi:hypothetical protein